ncbi:hypothetical protein OIV83_006350 [Microbotryomycetes sp. JL201]|nr:hypothetical protein OIV83_006350 [Microbotryomycetes sp. JL201]
MLSVAAHGFAHFISDYVKFSDNHEPTHYLQHNYDYITYYNDKGDDDDDDDDPPPKLHPIDSNDID